MEEGPSQKQGNQLWVHLGKKGMTNRKSSPFKGPEACLVCWWSRGLNGTRVNQLGGQETRPRPCRASWAMVRTSI